MVRFDEAEGEHVTPDALLWWLRNHPIEVRSHQGEVTRRRIVPVCLWGAKGVGKCLAPETEIVVDGRLIAIGDLWNATDGHDEIDGDETWRSPAAPLTVATLDAQTGQQVPGQVLRLFRQQVAEWGRRVVLDDGSTITMTQRHRVHGLDGWERELSVGDHVAVPSRLVGSGAPVDPDLTILLAWQISEGCESAQRSEVRIHQADPTLLHRLREAASRWSHSAGVNLNGMPVRDDELNICSREYRGWLEDRGYVWGRRSAQKRIPDWIVNADDATVALFLREYIAAEGHVTASGQVEISSASEFLIRQLSLMARRLGIWMRIRATRKAATNGSGIKRTYWSGLIMGASMRRLRDCIGVAHYAYKQDALEICASRDANSNVEGVPVGDLLIEARELTGLPRRRLGLPDAYFKHAAGVGRDKAQNVVATLRAIADGDSLRAFQAEKHNNRSHNATLAAYDRVDPHRFHELADRLQARIDREVHYAKVIKVEPVWLDGYVYDLEVADHHNYVAGGMVTHNTAQIKAYCEKYGLELRTYHPSHDDAGSGIVGETYRDEEANRTAYSIPSWLPVPSDPPGVLFMDEINRATRPVLQGLMEPLGEGTISQSGWQLPDHWQVVAAANPGEAGYDVEVMDDAMVDRLLHYAPGWDAPTWANWALGTQMAESVIDFALTHRDIIEIGETSLPIEVQDRLQATPRSLEYLAALVKDEKITPGLLRVISSGLLGRDVGPQFMAFYRSQDKPISFEELMQAGYARRVREWVDHRRWEMLSGTTLRLVTGLVSRDVDEATATELAKYLALLPDHVRQEAYQEIERSAGPWLEPLRAAAEQWLVHLAKRRAERH